MIKFINLKGKKFGKLVPRERIPGTKTKAAFWLCDCDCGNKAKSTMSNLRSGKMKTCGCEKRKRILLIKHDPTTHGDSKSLLYFTWRNMRERARNKKNKNYGARGIKVCKEWENSYESFKKWAFKNGYREDLMLDRIDFNRDYKPKNCRWITPKQSARNKRNNYFITFKGKTLTLSEWAELYSINYYTLFCRLRRKELTIEEALKKPYTPLWKTQG